MIDPKDILAVAAQKKEENYAFRSYLKMHADPDTLDRQFARLHKELFGRYDCCKCRNCCTMYCGYFHESDIGAAAVTLGISEEELIKKYLQRNNGIGYVTNNAPCDFLNGDGSCILGDAKPQDCKDFPFTDKPDRIGSLYGIVENADYCPIVFEMLEELKKEYGFKYKK